MKARMLSLAAALLLGSLTVVSAASAQDVDALFRDFEPDGQMLLELDGKIPADSKMYLAKRASAYLVTVPSLNKALVIIARTQKVEAVALDKVKELDNGTMGILADAEFEPLGSFDIQGDQVVSPTSLGALVLKPRPSLLGLRSAADLIEHNEAYGFKSDQYPPSAEVIAKLKKEGRDVQVRVYFGSWCSTCSRVVPWVVRVDRELEGSKIDFEYYGLPRTMDDESAKAMDIHGVPTVVVFVDGQEVGRRDASGLSVPEKALAEILGIS